jgi:phosphoribosylaminoimidazolecarboxamide formyltransferase/IMP cyclohydrolase
MKKRYALLSVSNKKGIVELARQLITLGFIILSTGGTAKELRSQGVEVLEVSDFTQSPEMFHGRVKTLHPIIMGAILYRREVAGDVADAEKFKISNIDLVIVNLYPFEQTVRKSGVTLDECIENIDIGGPSMLRAAAKNYKSVTVVIDPDDYGRLIGMLKINEGETTLGFRQQMALKVWKHTAKYDFAIAHYTDRAFSPAARWVKRILRHLFGWFFRWLLS